MRKTERIEIWRHNQRLWRNVRETTQQNPVPGYCPVHAVTEHLTCPACSSNQASKKINALRAKKCRATSWHKLLRA